MAASTPVILARPSGVASGRKLSRGLPSLFVIAGTTAIAVGGVVLFGWWLRIEPLTSIVPGLVNMKVNTALAFVLLGAGMLLRSRGSRATVPVVAAVVVLSAVVGSQYLLGRDLGIDQWLFREAPGQTGMVHPNRMAPISVICFLLISTGLLVLGRRGAKRFAQAMFFAVLVVAFLNLLDSTLEPTSPNLLAGYNQMPLITAAAFLVVSIGAISLLSGGGGFAAFTGASASAKLWRRLLVASVLVPSVLTWLWVRGADAGLYELEYGASLLVLGTVVFLAAVIRQAAAATQRSESSRQLILEERDRFFDVSLDMLATADANGYFIRLNPAWTDTLGYDLKDLTGRPFLDFVHPDDRDATNAEAARQVERGQTVFNFQNRYRHRDGTYRWLEWTSTPSADGTRLYAMARDITARKGAEERLETMVAPAREAQSRREEAHRRIEAVIAYRAFRPVFQPILELATRRIVGFEALTRFDDGGTPDTTFAAALDCGLGIELERVTLEAALQGARLLPPGTWLSLNVSPPLLAQPTVLRRLLASKDRPVVLEITEHEAITEYGPLRAAALHVGADVRLAVDDAGAGVANFNHLVELRPDFLKIDVCLVRDVDEEVGRQAVVAGLVHFAASARCQVIAEGIETDAELAMVRSLGVMLGQGYLLGRPANVEAWSHARTSNDRTAPRTHDPRKRPVTRARDPGRSASSPTG